MTLTSFTVAGGVEEALTHFAAAGLAEILTDADVETVRWGWRDGVRARAVVETTASPEKIGEIVLRHAQRCAQDESWVQAAGPGGRRGVLSPRVGASKSREGWAVAEDSRVAALDRVPADAALDHRFLASLGRPAYWTVDTARPNPDAGASRWEMKTRNHGETFVGERLAPLADIVAARSAQSIVDGLSGAALVDEVGKGKPESRVATGLVSPRPVDNALAWCAMWGLSATAVWWNPTGIGTSTGVAPATVTHPTMAALPVFMTPVTAARYRRVLRSAAWANLCRALREVDGHLALGSEAAVVDATAHGVAVCVAFHIHTDRSGKAPARHLYGGRSIGLRSADALTRMPLR